MAQIPPVLILLPPSEGKFAPSDGAPVDLDSLASADVLGERQWRLLDALEQLATVATRRRSKQLDVSRGRWGSRRGRGAADRPDGAAATIYTGVLYERLQLPSCRRGRDAGADRQHPLGGSATETAFRATASRRKRG